LSCINIPFNKYRLHFEQYEEISWILKWCNVSFRSASITTVFTTHAFVCIEVPKQSSNESNMTYLWCIVSLDKCYQNRTYYITCILFDGATVLYIASYCFDCLVGCMRFSASCMLWTQHVGQSTIPVLLGSLEQTSVTQQTAAWFLRLP